MCVCAERKQRWRRFGLLCWIITHEEERGREGGPKGWTDGEKEPEERHPGRQRTEGVGRHSIKTNTRNMAIFTGTWKMKSSENFDDLLKALGEDLLFLFCEDLL